MFVSLGLDDVETYIQSGNVLFCSRKEARELAEWLTESVQSVLGPGHDVFVFSREDLLRAVSRNPLESMASQPGFHGHLMFLSHKPSDDRVQTLVSIGGSEYQFRFFDKVLYYGYVLGADRRRRTIDIEKILDVVGTSRTVNVVKKLIDLMQPT